MSTSSAQPPAGEPPAAPAAQRMEYSAFLAERQKMVDARQRAQQRIDQVISAGAAGALVLSITFLEKIAPEPRTETILLLASAWVCLLVALAANFISHFLSQRVFDDAISAFDDSFTRGVPYVLHSNAESGVKALEVISGIAFLLGAALLTAFALANLSVFGGQSA